MFKKTDQTEFIKAGDGLLTPQQISNRGHAVERGTLGKSMLYDKNRKDNSQLHWLYNLACAAPDGTAVECGVYLGGSLVTWALARGKDRGDIIAVDNWASSNIPGNQKKVFLNSMRVNGVHIFWVMEMNSWVAPEYIDSEIAFCFIDANHSESGFPNDLAVWPPKIMTGGIICFHDYDVWKPPVVVKKYIDKWYDEKAWEYLGLVGSAIAFRRR